MSDHLELEYDLFALPTAQHRAGLAGLLVILGCMRNSGFRDVPSEVRPRSGVVRLALTRSSLTALFNYLYDARKEEDRTQTRRTGKTGVLLREEEEVTTDRRGKVAKRKILIYEVVKPKAHFLEALGMPEVWVAFWRDIMLRTVRSIYMQKEPYRRRVAGQDADPPDPTWNDLTARKERSIELSRSLFLGAETHTADNVPFRGRPAETLLLHFWPVVMGMGEIRRLRLEKEEGGQKRRPREERLGYLITVP
ncbi:MAG: type I-MYXAN CRISPR-associated protein Cmx8, partial [Dehalococcoidia bacterium]